MMLNMRITHLEWSITSLSCLYSNQSSFKNL